MKNIFINPTYKHFLHGGDYNRDQWQDCPEILEEDMRLMKLANCNSMTLGIFAWTALEPEEGKYDFSFLDKAMDDVYANGGRVILATPSAARPAWLAQKYPEIMRVTENRERTWFGGRHNHCPTSPIYREKVGKINTLLAERYANHPALLAWHVSNEYGGDCFCDLCRAAFRDWLKEKYGTLDKLNKQWWTAFWSHTYTDWDQIDPLSPLGERSLHGLYLDWKRFSTHQVTDFFKNEIVPLRKFTPNIPVTTNTMGFYPGYDYRVLTKEVDFVSNDSYPTWRGDASDIKTASNTSLNYDLNRSFKHKPFVQMECTPSNVNWHDYNKLKRPGMHMLASMQLVAHGSESVLYFQWRKSRGSCEKFHGAVVDHAGHENTRVFREVSEVGARLKKLDDVIGTMTVSRVALVYDWQNRWALDKAQGFQNKDKKVHPTLAQYYFSLWKRGINVEIIGYNDDLTTYDLVIAPQMYMASDEMVDKIESYVKNGGTILCTYMAAMVNENDLCHLGGFPGGKLKDVFGIWNEEIDTLYPDDKNSVTFDKTAYDAIDYCEVVHAEGAKVLATYDADYYKGMPAFTVNTYGKGKAYYVTFRDKGDFTDVITERLLNECGIISDFDGTLPYGMTAHSRTDGENLYVFLQNFSTNPLKTSTAHTWVTVDGEESISGEITLDSYETLILSRKI